jgi:hypothetical protein
MKIHTVVEILLHPEKMHHVMCSQQARAYWTDLCGGYHYKPVILGASAR